MGTGQKILTATLWAMLIAVMAGVVGVGVWQRVRGAPQSAPSDTPQTNAGERLPVLWDAPNFSLVNQDGQPVSKTDLQGHVWVASFIFTHCAGPCPMISGKMERLQKHIADPSIKLVSFTVDPERDTPEVLKSYAKGFEADPQRWSFLTGTVAQMDQVTEGMRIAAKRQPGDEQVVHGTYLMLVDGKGRVRAEYGTQAMSSEDLMQVAADAAKLAAEKTP